MLMLKSLLFLTILLVFSLKVIHLEVEVEVETYAFILMYSHAALVVDQVSQYNKDGYLVIKNLLSQEEIDRYSIFIYVACSTTFPLTLPVLSVAM